VTDRFSLDGLGVLAPEPVATFEDGVVYGVRSAAPHDARIAPHVSVAWLEEPAGVSLEQVVREDLARTLSRPEAVLLDQQPVAFAGGDCVRTFTADISAGGVPTASEQWRMLAGGRRWTVTATTALADQPEWGPRLAAVAATFRPA
jgi:hypothetical protein